MATKRPTTVAGYIAAAAPVARPHLRTLRRILRSVAPHADEVIKWNAPFYVEPRFLFSFGAFKSYCVLAPTPAALAEFREELEPYETTKNFFKIPYNKPVPEALVRKIAKFRLQTVGARQDDGFW
jgi:uncharacterized protein YdhG (YjbR/CyaY superfamily)